MLMLGDKTLVRVYAKHEPYTDGHLGKVWASMQELGVPAIEVVEWRGDYFAVEGSHRLACAFEEGICPDLIITVPDLTGPEAEAFWDEAKKRLPCYSWLV